MFDEIVQADSGNEDQDPTQLRIVFIVEFISVAPNECDFFLTLAARSHKSQIF